MERSSRLMLDVTVAVLILVLLAELSSAQVTNVPPRQLVYDPAGIRSSANPKRWEAYFAELGPAIPDSLPQCFSRYGCKELKLMKKSSTLSISEYKGQPSPRTYLPWNHTAFPNITKAMAGDYVCENEYGMAQQSYQLNVVANLSIQCPLTVDVLFNTTSTVIVNSMGSLLSKVISNSSLASLTSNHSTSTDGSVNLSTTWNTSRNLALNSTNSIKWTAMYTFKDCSASTHYPSVKQNCEKAREPVTCTTKINIYKNCQNFSRQDISPSSPPSLNFRTNFPVNCSANYVRNKFAGVNVAHVTCQRDGKWSGFPSCIFCNCSQGDDCVSTASGAKCIPTCTSSPAPCNLNAICSDTTEKIVCTCRTGYTGNGTDTDGCIPIRTTMTATMTTNTTSSMQEGQVGVSSTSASSSSASSSSFAVWLLCCWCSLRLSSFGGSLI